ncbi:SRSF protein kinase 2-like [Cucurbita moschata]|uniref:non-specific serine/threonine protein kinase n=1 Tax=Cucurbita moschata TaxID=3662 RepID=A0A6J1EYP4_CUCMO|nr:SRSF protein kinase 2-like [Cucurbita moschata]XP_022933306.1 SRSF protein kinase 2-like [Cucurbita moschata]
MWSFACICFKLATGDVLFDPQSGGNYERDEDHFALMMELLGVMSRKIALGGCYSRDYFNRYGELRHIRQLRFWPLNKVFTEKYDFSKQDANDLADFLVPLLNFVPEKRLRAAQCLSHPWLSYVSRILESSVSTHQNQPKDQELQLKEARRTRERSYGDCNGKHNY